MARTVRTYEQQMQLQFTPLMEEAPVRRAETPAQSAAREYREEKPRLTGQLAYLLDILNDGAWRTIPQVVADAAALGHTISETGASAQLRNLRKPEHGGYTIERTKHEGQSWYRLVVSE